MPKISVIIPVYNVAEYIKDCIQSLLAQTFRDFEIILVDDSGTDNSVEIAEKILEQNAFANTGKIGTEESLYYTVLKHDHNRGLSAARNTGLAAAKGEYVYFLDSDDYTTPDCLEKLYSQAIATNADITIGGYKTIGGDSCWLPKLNGKENVICNTTDETLATLHAYLSGEYYVMAWNKLCKKSFLIDNNINFIEGLVHEDEPWTFACALKAKTIALGQEETYVYRVRENSLQTGKNFAKHFKSYVEILKAISYTAEDDFMSKVIADPIFAAWYERRKALYFSETCEKGTKAQQAELYHVIRQCSPQPHWTKSDFHYYMPECIGIIAYRKFHKYKLC